MPVRIERGGGVKIYETVAERIAKFREKHPADSGWGLISELSYEGDIVRCRVSMVDPSGRTVATGHAEENRRAGLINRTSAVENAETSALGRCLMMAGFGGGEFRPADELASALQRQAEILEAERVASSGGIPVPAPAMPVEPAPAAEPAPEAPAVNLPRLDGVEYTETDEYFIAGGPNHFANRNILKDAGFRYNPQIKRWVLKKAA